MESIIFLIGVITGSIAGIIITCLCYAAKNIDEDDKGEW